MAQQLIEIISKNEEETKVFARKIAENSPPIALYALNGTLGMGKSVFARAFIRHLMGDDVDVPSPTFTLVQSYETKKATLWHFDLYRTKTPEEIYEIGWEEALGHGICLVEWSERLGNLLPENHINIKFESLGDNARNISVSYPKTS